ncbi:methyl-coenzyme M reductase operon protein D [Methanogenium cariaci]|uniref:methyl-coenzyme M reductase operon protein D n=1 Tax=Methanogenium cariaci TaxID=2197 RepID=UPI00248027AC|nr:methyl-coenzyme M reductase operon protein D [Methanogenium cariaci]
MLKPDSAEALLNEVVKIPGIRRMMINGPNLPRTVPYGPARGGNPTPPIPTVKSLWLAGRNLNSVFRSGP